jgi:hypothetical protein
LVANEELTIWASLLLLLLLGLLLLLRCKMTDTVSGERQNEGWENDGLH